MDEADAILARFAHADDPAAAHVDPRIAHILERVEPVLVLAAGDDPLVIFRPGVDIVVIVVEARFLEHLRLFWREHAERHAGFETHIAHTLHDLDDGGHVTVLGIAPGRTHAEALAARILRLRRRLQHGAHVHQLGRLDPAIGLHRLRAIAAILGTPSGLD